MNTLIKKGLLLAGIASIAATAQAVQIHGWDFSNLDPFGPGADWSMIPANHGAIGTGMIWTTEFEQLDSVNGSNIGTFQVTTNDGTTVGTAGTSFSQDVNDPAALAIFNSGVNGKGIVVQFSTLGQTDIMVSMAARANSAAANSNTWSYSLDGTNYTPIAGTDSYSGLDIGNYVERSFDLSNIAAIENAPAVYLKYSLSGSTATGANPEGAFAIDNLQVTAVPEPATYAAIFGGIIVALTIVKRRKN